MDEASSLAPVEGSCQNYGMHLARKRLRNRIIFEFWMLLLVASPEDIHGESMRRGPTRDSRFSRRPLGC